MLPVIEMFSSIQGEGKYAGVPSIFIRTSGCNLRCAFKGSICDTPYSSYNPEKSPYKTMDELVSAFEKLSKKNPRTTHVVITGGEPLLHRKDLSEFLTRINPNGEERFFITVETNGTLPPVTYNLDEDDELDKFNGASLINLYSISPKLSTSVGTPNEILTKEQIERHNKLRLNPQHLAELFTYSNDTQFKFVYSSPEVEKEIDDLMGQVKDILIEKFGWDESEITYGPHNDSKAYYDLNDFIMLMPEGIESEQLDKTSLEAAEMCVRRGWTYTDRLQIRIWGNKRGV